MNKFFRRILIGLIIAALPFLVGMAAWDLKANTSKIGIWYPALVAFAWAVGFSIASCIYFKGVKKKEAIGEGWITGITWYVELLIIEYLVLVIGMGQTMMEFAPIFLTYLNTIAISAAIGYIISK